MSCKAFSVIPDPGPAVQSYLFKVFRAPSTKKVQFKYLHSIKVFNSLDTKFVSGNKYYVQ